jgi:hypothetical protein
MIIKLDTETRLYRLRLKIQSDAHLAALAACDVWFGEARG